MTLKEKRIDAIKKECSLNKNKTEIKKDVKMNITVHDVIQWNNDFRAKIVDILSILDILNWI